jgi:ApbE superfamily uncharacterized protein (UPF0280 family)
MSDRRIEILPSGRGVFAENGPMRLTIQVFSHGSADLQMAARAGDYAFSCLEEVSRAYSLLRRRHGLLDSLEGSAIGARMLASVKAVGDEDLTPMAAVAGTIADSVADWCVAEGAEKVIVDNGGDISIRLQKNQTVRVGLRPEVYRNRMSHLVQLREGYSSWGVNTSGMGGRSFTRGVASAVTVFAGNSSIADAAATAIANSCCTPEANIHRLPANVLAADSDLGDLPVTVGIQEFSQGIAKKCLSNGLKRAGEIVAAGMIRGGILVMNRETVLTTGFHSAVGLLEEV